MKRFSTPPALDDDDLRQLLLRTHVHDDGCFGAYEPCGEQHAHDAACGARPLICHRDSDPDAAAYVAVISELLSRRAVDLTAKEREMLRVVRDVVSDSDLLQWNPDLDDPELSNGFDERDRACTLLDKLIGPAV